MSPFVFRDIVEVWLVLVALQRDQMDCLRGVLLSTAAVPPHEMLVGSTNNNAACTKIYVNKVVVQLL